VLVRFREWVQGSMGRGFDPIAPKEVSMVLGVLLLTPVFAVTAPLWFFPSEEFRTAPTHQKVLMVILVPVLVPLLYIGVVALHLVWPMIRRTRERRRLLRQADTAVRELAHMLARTEWEWNAK
jgi:hypothetical protein